MLANAPILTPQDYSQLDNAEQIQPLYQQAHRTVANRNQASKVIIDTQQVESLLGVLHRAYDNVEGRISIGGNQAVLQLSAALPIAWERRFINISIGVEPGPGLTVTNIQIGSLLISGKLALRVAAWLVDSYTSTSSGSLALDSIESLAMSRNSLTVFLKPVGPLLDELRRIDTGEMDPQKRLQALSVASYLRVLEEYEATHGYRSRSLTDYLRVVFAKAEQDISSSGGLSSELEAQQRIFHNQSAILSLAIFSGHYRVGTLVGKNVQLDVNNPSTTKHPATLANRNDLARHFIISAALKVLADQGFSLAVGEFKELLDRARSGSGYSFVDLAADYAGVEFALLATAPEKAAFLQKQMATLQDESIYFPNIDGLPEGLSKPQFTARFKFVDSPEYNAMVDTVKMRVKSLPLYAEAIE